MADQEDTNWSELPIVCPHCGNHGEPDGPWQENGWTPFKLVEEVVRSWVFDAKISESGSLIVLADSGSGDIDAESGADFHFECMQCFGQFPVPRGVQVDFD